MPTPPPAPPAAGAPPRIVVREVAMSQPLDWLRRGLEDLLRCPLPGLVHGGLSALFGLGLVLLARDHFWILAGAFSGFLIVAPVVATGLYAISRALERGEPASLATAWQVWRGHDPRLVHFGVLLGFAGTGWVLTSASLVTSFATLPVLRPVDFIYHVVLDHRSWLFEVWLVLGALLAAPMFASSVVAIPLLLERRGVSVLQAVLASWRAVLASPAPMAFWAGILLVITLVGMATLLVGLIVVVPWLAHASWHAYRDIVAADEGTGDADARAGGPAEPR
jgi:uncharacterized membrane protein